MQGPRVARFILLLDYLLWRSRGRSWSFIPDVKDIPLTQLPSSGGFDVPREKCPPDISSGGSSDEVTARLAQAGSHHYLGPGTLPFPQRSASTPVSTTTKAVAIHRSNSDPRVSARQALLQVQAIQSNRCHSAPSTPPGSYKGIGAAEAEFARRLELELPMTPTSSTPGSSPAISVNSAMSQHVTQPISKKVVNGFTISIPTNGTVIPDTPPATPDASVLVRHHAPEAFLQQLFVKDAKRAAVYATPLSIHQDEPNDAGITWEGFVLTMPNSKGVEEKTLYVCGRGAEKVQLRESIVALLDLAEEHLSCTAFVIALERSSPALAGLIHSLMYVSGQVMTKPPFEVDRAWVCVGIEI